MPAAASSSPARPLHSQGLPWLSACTTPLAVSAVPKMPGSAAHSVSFCEKYQGSSV